MLAPQAGRRADVATSGPRRPEPMTELGFDEGGLLDGRYRLVKQLGEGGMGAVYLVDDLLLRQRCALKTLRRDRGLHPDELERFRREVALTHSIHHPNVARTYDIGEEGGVHYLSMEWLEGESLMARIKRDELLSPEEARSIAVPLCKGLSAAHEAGVIHRDLKPANIMLVKDERQCVVVDFGVAAHVGDPAALSMAGESLARDEEGQGRWEVTSAGRGTPAYMAPEQWNEETGDARTDIYSLGVVLYVALTGRAPYAADSLEELADRHRSDAPPDVRVACPGADGTLARVIQACMAKHPDDRPQSVDEVLGLLEGPQRIRRWLLRMVAALVISAVAAVGLRVGVFELAKGALIQELRPALERLAQVVAHDLTVDELRAMESSAWGRAHPLFGAVTKKLRRHRIRNGEITGVYVFGKTPEPGVYRIVADAIPDDDDENHDGVIADSEKGVVIGESYDGRNYPAMAAALASSAPQSDRQFLEDDWGVSLSGYLAVSSDPQDRQLFVGVDSSNELLTSLRRRLSQFLFGVGALFVLVMGVLTWPLRRGGYLWRRG